MISVYRKTNLECCKIVTSNYTKSFSIAILTFNLETRKLIYSLYAFLRYADEIIDTLNDYDQKTLFDEFRSDTFKAIQRGISTNPILDSFQSLVNECNIEISLIESFFNSMAMDLEKQDYDEIRFQEYVYGSAEVLGLLCLKIASRNNPECYEINAESAQKMAATFQKINFMRDLKNDFVIQNKCYLYHVMDNGIFNENAKKKMENEIKLDIKNVSLGISLLPKSWQLGCLISYNMYILYFRKIQNATPQNLLNRGINVLFVEKIAILFFFDL